MNFSMYPWILVFGCALGFSGAALALGYGWPIAVICAATGAVAGFRASRRLLIPADLTYSANSRAKDDFSRERDVVDAYERPDEKNISRLSRVTTPLGPYQKFAFLAFLAQATICFLLILLGWLAAKIGWNGSAINPEFIKNILYKLFPMQASNTQAQAMLSFIFVPLIVFYAVSMTGFIAAVFRSAGALVSDIKSNWRLLILIVGIIVFVLTVLYPADSYQASSKLKRWILDGGLFTYIVFFCFVPLFGMLVSHALPEENSRQQ